MRAVVRTGAAVRSVRATRRDLLLETLALRHQLGVLARSNKRIRPADRLFWLFLRWFWPRWRDALVLIQPASVDRWHLEAYAAAGAAARDVPEDHASIQLCRDLIRRMAGENCLWGAPRIHGELLKLGFTISERTVSRYLRGRPTTRSQTWRTFFANHFAGQTFISPVMFADTDDEDIVVDASDVSLRPVQPIDASYASIHGPTVDWRYSRQLSSLGVILGQHPLQGRTGARKSSGRDPPPRLPFQPASWHLRGFSFVRGDTASATDGSVRSTAARDRPFAVLSLSSKNNQVVNVVGRPALQSAWCPRCDLRGSKYWRTTARSRTAGSSQDRDRGKECSRIWEFAILEAFGIPIRTAYLRGTDAASQCLL